MSRVIPLPHWPRRQAFGVAALAAVLFAALAGDLVLHGPVTRADPQLSAWLHAHLNATVTTLMMLVTDLHSTVGICAMAAIAAAVLALCGQRHWVPMLLVSVPGGVIVNALVKTVFQRARPVLDAPLVTLTSYSFPSGHAAGATVWWGFMLVLGFALERRAGYRALMAAGVTGMVLLTAASRVYLGAHYLSDVLAGVAEGTAWLMLCFACRPLPTRRPSPG